MVCQYSVEEETFYSKEIGTYKTYGIKCTVNNGSKCIRLISDVSTDKEFVLNLVNQFNKLRLNEIHFSDAVLDAINF